MRAKLANAWELVTSSLWFVPALLVAAALALAVPEEYAAGIALSGSGG